MIFLNTHYTRKNAAPEVLEFLDYIRTNDGSIPPEGDLTRKAREYADRIRGDRSKEGIYMTYAMSLRESYRDGMEEGRQEGRKKGLEEGLEEGREEGIRAMISALRGLSLSQELAVKNLMEHFGLGKKDAEEKVRQYW